MGAKKFKLPKVPPGSRGQGKRKIGTITKASFSFKRSPPKETRRGSCPIHCKVPNYRCKSQNEPEKRMVLGGISHIKRTGAAVPRWSCSEHQSKESVGVQENGLRNEGGRSVPVLSQEKKKTDIFA